MPSYFLDTNVCIELLRGKAGPRKLPADCKLSALVAAELWTGAHKAADPTRARLKLEALFELFEIVPFDAEAARHYGEIRAQLEKSGNPIGSIDQIIAAHARSAGATLLTANLREFKRVPGLTCHAWD